MRRPADADGRRGPRRRRRLGDRRQALPAGARGRVGGVRPRLSRPARREAPGRAARCRPVQRHEDAPARRLGGAPGRPGRLAPARLPGLAAGYGAIAPPLGPPGRRGGRRLRLRRNRRAGPALRGRVPSAHASTTASTSTGRPGPGDGPALDRASGLPEAPPGTLRVGLVATFATWKGHGVFLDAVARLPADSPARFYIVGGPIYRSAGSQVSLDELRAHAAGLGLGDRVGFAGHQADPAAAAGGGSDVVVTPARGPSRSAG